MTTTPFIPSMSYLRDVAKMTPFPERFKTAYEQAHNEVLAGADPLYVIKQYFPKVATPEWFVETIKRPYDYKRYKPKDKS
jgi:hypothetical protein